MYPDWRRVVGCHDSSADECANQRFAGRDSLCVAGTWSAIDQRHQHASAATLPTATVATDSGCNAGMFEHATASTAAAAWFDLFFCAQLYLAWSKRKH
jgi:hypothetical protein